jgi:hypothetical protein
MKCTNFKEIVHEFINWINLARKNIGCLAFVTIGVYHWFNKSLKFWLGEVLLLSPELRCLKSLRCGHHWNLCFISDRRVCAHRNSSVCASVSS